MIDVDVLPAGQDEAWDEFLLASKGGVLYQSTAYRNLLEEELRCEPEYLVASEGGEIRGVLPLMWAAAGDSRVLNSLPFYGSHGGPVSTDRAAEAALIDAWNERATDPGTSAATMVSNPFLSAAPPDPAFNLEDERLGQVTPLADADAESLMSAYSKNARRDVRRAERRGVSVSRDQDRLGDIAELHAQNITAIGGKPKSSAFFERVLEHFSAGEDLDVWVASLDGEMIGGLLVFYFNGVAEYYTPAVDRSHQADEPMALILLNAMLEAARKGCGLWNWGGTWIGQEGVRQFKRKWGATEMPYRYFIHVNDQELLKMTPDALKERFPDFYVAPFSALEPVA